MWNRLACSLYTVSHRRDCRIYLENFLSLFHKSKTVFSLQSNGCETTFNSELCSYLSLALLGPPCVEWQYQHVPQGGAQSLDVILHGCLDSTTSVKWLSWNPRPENRLSSCQFYPVASLGVAEWLRGRWASEIVPGARLRKNSSGCQCLETSMSSIALHIAEEAFHTFRGSKTTV